MLIAEAKQEEALYFDEILEWRCQRIHCDLFTKRFGDISLFSPPRYILLTFAPAISQYQMCRQPSFLPDEFFEKRNLLQSFVNPPDGSSYTYSANGHRFESYHNPFEKKQQITDFINCLSHLPARCLWKVCVCVFVCEGVSEMGFRKASRRARGIRGERLRAKSQTDK